MRCFLLLLAVSFVAAGDPKSLIYPKGIQALNIRYETKENLLLIRSFEEPFDLDFLKITSDYAEVLVAIDQASRFKDLLNENDIAYTVIDKEFRRSFAEEYVGQQLAHSIAIRDSSCKGTFSFSHYPNYVEILEYLENIANTHRDVASLIEIGKTFEGRPIKGLKIASGEEGNAAVFIDAGIHAREWIAPVTALYMIDQLVVNKTNRYLLNGADWYIVPSLNPDGYEYSHSDSQNRLWRKTRSTTEHPTCRGVDGNRNFDLEWMTVGASSNPCSTTYAGPKAFSEPETQALRDFVTGRNGTIKLYFTLHSYGQYILFPWGYTTEPPKNKAELETVALILAKAIQKVYGTRYTYGSSASHLYPAAGGSDDWAMGKGGADLSYTIELPGGSFLLPPRFIKFVVKETFEIVKVAHSYVRLAYPNER